MNEDAYDDAELRRVIDVAVFESTTRVAEAIKLAAHRPDIVTPTVPTWALVLDDLDRLDALPVLAWTVRHDEARAVTLAPVLEVAGWPVEAGEEAMGRLHPGARFVHGVLTWEEARAALLAHLTRIAEERQEVGRREGHVLLGPDGRPVSVDQAPEGSTWSTPRTGPVVEAFIDSIHAAFDLVEELTADGARWEDAAEHFAPGLLALLPSAPGSGASPSRSSASRAGARVEGTGAS